MKSLLLISLLVLGALQTAYSQQRIDSLLAVLKTSRPDSNAVNTMDELCWAYRDEGNETEARKVAEKSLELAKKLQYKYGIACATQNLGVIELMSDDRIPAFRKFTSALAIFQELGKKRKEKVLYRLLGLWHQDMDNYPEALRMFYKSFRVPNSSDEKAFHALLYQDLSNIYLAQKNHQAAIKFSQRSINEFSELKDYVAAETSRVTLSYVYIELGDFDVARAQLESVIQFYINRKLNDYVRYAEYALADLNRQEGRQLVTQKRPAEAREKLISATGFYETLSREKGGQQDRAADSETYFNLAECHLLLQNIELARKYQVLGYDLCQQDNNKLLLEIYFKNAYKIDSATGNYHKAFINYKNTIAYRDSMNNEENIRKSEGYQMQYEFEKKEDQIKLLSTENKLKTLLAKEEKQQKNLAFAGIGTILIAGGYGFYLFQKKKKRQNRQSLMKERLRISRELHDEVGATLSGIAMYSHLTKEQIKSEDTAAVQNSLNVMQQSSAEMVNKLNDIVWLVNPEQDTLEKLVRKLEEYASDMAMIKDMQVKVTLPENLANLELPIDSRRNIYLFYKEAINNAVKYSGGSLLVLNISEQDGKLEFSLADNGRGFDEVNVRRGNGLNNMQKRADEIGARLILKSDRAGGTEVAISLKVGRL